MRKDRIEQLQLALDEERKFRDGVELVQRIIEVGLRALALRLLTTLVLVADCVLFAWAMAAGSWQSVGVAVLFAIAAWSVLYLRPPDRKESES